jgi:hypothetical protein
MLTINVFSGVVYQLKLIFFLLKKIKVSIFHLLSMTHHIYFIVQLLFFYLIEEIVKLNRLVTIYYLKHIILSFYYY